MCVAYATMLFRFRGSSLGACEVKKVRGFQSEVCAVDIGIQIFQIKCCKCHKKKKKRIQPGSPMTAVVVPVLLAKPADLFLIVLGKM